MTYQACTFDDLTAFLKCLHFEAVEMLDDEAEQQNLFILFARISIQSEIGLLFPITQF